MFSDQHDNWRDNCVAGHFARQNVAFIADGSEVRYINEYATQETIEASISLRDEHGEKDIDIPELGTWCVVGRKASPDQSLKTTHTWLTAKEVLELAAAEGWHIPAGPDGTAGWWDGHGQWRPHDLDFDDLLDELPPEA